MIHTETVFTYDAPPKGETPFNIPGDYRRAYDRCTLCGHWYSRHDINLTSLYGRDYVEATYGERVQATFDRIMALPEDGSDNIGRTRRITEFAAAHWVVPRDNPRLLDIGSGLAVFPARMKSEGWACTALDPDPRAAEHARTVAGVEAVTSDFLNADIKALGMFDAITLNKVLEHVEDPVAMLARCRNLLSPAGFVYVEVPDGEAAAAEGPGREEFFIEHHHVFSPASLAMLADRAGFSPVHMERLREPSGKYTVRGFLVSS